MATNFFEQQDDARRRTGLLIFYFALAVVAIIATVYLAVTAILARHGGARQHGSALVRPGDGLAAVATLGRARDRAWGACTRSLPCRKAAQAVARLLGGRLVDPGRACSRSGKLLNVVEEMALASGMPVPPVYVLDNEASINAFAAGYVAARRRGGRQPGLPGVPDARRAARRGRATSSAISSTATCG